MTNEFEIQRRCANFLYKEAKLLDSRELDDWLGLLGEDIEYRVPIRVTRERGSDKDEFRDSYWLEENKQSLRARVKRLENPSAWVENPPSRTRRIVGNVLAEPQADGEIEVESNFILKRFHMDETEVDRSPETLVGSREDTLDRSGDDLKLTKRTVYLEHTTVPARNLIAFF